MDGSQESKALQLVRIDTALVSTQEQSFGAFCSSRSIGSSPLTTCPKDSAPFASRLFECKLFVLSEAMEVEQI